MHGEMGESKYTQYISDLVKCIQSNTPVRDSLFEQAKIYFDTCEQDKQTLDKLTQYVTSLEAKMANASKKDKFHLQDKHENALNAMQKEAAAQNDARLARLSRVNDVCAKLLALAEGNDWEETQTKSARVLGTLQLLSPGDGLNIVKLNQTLKPAYKGVVALRLLDKLLCDGKITNQYILSRYENEHRYFRQGNRLSQFQQEVVIPILGTCILQDVGLLHPKAQVILKGKEGDLDEYRVLEKETRLELLRINFQATQDYLINGLGMSKYKGNSKTQRAAYIQNEKERLKFIQSMIVGAHNPKLGIGNLIKVPQIYASIIFSSKASYDFRDLPKATLLVAKTAETGAISKFASDSLLAIFGHFPQGFGITYIPKDANDKELDRYEYAIVTKLNPADPYVPECKVVTRNLTFIANGNNMAMPKESNLFFASTRKKLEKMSPERLKEILSKLVSNFEERMELDLIPSFWNPHGFFGYKKMQNLWKKG